MTCAQNKDKLRKLFTLRNELARQSLCEFYGMFIYSVLVRGLAARATLSKSTPNFHTAFSIGMALSLSIYTGFGVSGGHLNSSVSIGLAAVGAFPWWKVPFYVIVQLLGGFLGAGAAYLIYTDSFDDLDGGTRQVFGENGTAAIFATFPQPFLSPITAFFEQILNTALMLALIGAVADHRNQAPSQGVIPLLFGFIVFVIIHAYGYNAGAPLNPTLDLSGRLVLTAAGYGSDVWIPHGFNWWVIAAIVGPTIGAAVGSWSYYLAVQLHHPRVVDTAELGLDDNPSKQESDMSASGLMYRNSVYEDREDNPPEVARSVAEIIDGAKAAAGQVPSPDQDDQCGNQRDSLGGTLNDVDIPK